MIVRFATSLFLCLALLSGCAAQSPETAGAPPGEKNATGSPPQRHADAPKAAAPTTPAADSMERAPAMPGFDPSSPDRRCKTDADCTVKDVGNCCGYFPMCVHKDAKTDPAAVRAACEKSGMASICGFQEVKGCQCVQGRCENVADSAAVM